MRSDVLARPKDTVAHRAGNRQVSVLMLDGSASISLLVARCLSQFPQFRLHVLSSQAWPPLRFSRHRASFHVHPAASDHAASLDIIEKKVAQLHPDVILPIEDRATEFAAAHQESLAGMAALPPLPEPAVLKCLSDKDQLAEFCQREGIAVPETRAILPATELESRVSEISFPALLKPARGRSGSGIRRFEDAADMIEYVQTLDLCAVPPMIAQSVVPGYDIDCSLLCREGEILAHTIQRGFLPRSGTYQPQAGIQFIDDDEILNSTTTLVRAARFSGVAHLDFRRDERDGRARLVDVNIRFWGSLLGSLLMGVNFPYLACQSALGLPFDYPEYRRGRYIDFGAVVKQTARSLTLRPYQRFKFGETGLKYILRDPLAEVAKLARQFCGS